MTLDRPLCFRPLFRRAIWGGRRLESLLHKPLPEGDDFGESWEIVDHGQDQSVVTGGPFAGKTLGSLVRTEGRDLFGNAPVPAQFPLLFKFLDAHRDLSVQVHPDDLYAATLSPPDHGKTEAWVVLHADPGSLIYAGLRPEVTREVLEQQIGLGQIEACLHKFQPSVGDCLLIPAGTVHALGKGLVVAEIQQSSDTTFRLYDWNRVGPDGLRRPLHIEQALEVIDYQRGPITPTVLQTPSECAAERLITCSKFCVDRWQWNSPRSLTAPNRFHILVVLDGTVRIRSRFGDTPLEKGQTVLLPAAAIPVDLVPVEFATLLDIYSPG